MRNSLITTFIKYNSQLNLSAIREPDEIFLKHIQDALELEKIIKLDSWKKIVDVGTWWWFPLLPLATQYPENTFVWIDARQKKIRAINNMIEELWLSNAKAIRTRMEEHTEKYDYLTARAVAYIDKLRPRSQKLLKKWWRMILYKLRSEEENADIKKLCKRERLSLEAEHHYKLYKEDVERVIYVIRTG